MANLMSLPNELLIQILSHLEYFDLRISIPATNRRLKDITLRACNGDIDQNFAERLFISKLQPFTVDYCPTKDEDEKMQERHGALEVKPNIFTLHPCLQHLKIRQSPIPLFDEDFTLQEDDIGFVTPSGSFIPLSKTAVSQENATSPASDFTFIIVKIPRPGSIWWSELDGRNQIKGIVSVMDIMREIILVLKPWQSTAERAPNIFIEGDRAFRLVELLTMRGLDREDETRFDPRIEVAFDITEQGTT